MSISQPPVEHRQTGPSADDVDGLLRDFFQASLPRPWPTFNRPLPEVMLPLPRPAGWRQRFRSSLALAASLLLLGVSLWLLTGKMPDRSSSQVPDGPTTADPTIPGDPHRHGTPQPENQ